MEQEIILEGIHAMLEEIRDNMKKNPGQEMINSRLAVIEKTCNDLAEKKFVTEDVLAQFLACTLQKIAEMNKKQEEKVKKLNESILEYHEFMRKQGIDLEVKTNNILKLINEELMDKRKEKNIFVKIFEWFFVTFSCNNKM